MQCATYSRSVWLSLFPFKNKWQPVSWIIIQLSTKNINHWAKQIATKGSPCIVEATNEAVFPPPCIKNDYFQDAIGEGIITAFTELDKVPKSS